MNVASKDVIHYLHTLEFLACNFSFSDRISRKRIIYFYVIDEDIKAFNRTHVY